MKKLAKLKTFLCGVFTAVLAFCLALGGIALLTNTPATAEEGTATESTAGHWVEYKNRETYYSDYGLTYLGRSTIFSNQQDILSFEDNTVRFQLQVDKSSAWSGFTFLNGLTGEGDGLKTWSSYSWASYQGGIQVHQSIIFQNGSGQTYPAVNAAQPNAGVENIPSSFSDYPITVEVHIGTGEDGDVSYVKMMDKMLCWQGTSDSVFNGITTADFANGCYMVFHVNLAAEGNNDIYVTEYQNKNSPRVGKAPTGACLSTSTIDDTYANTTYIYFYDYGDIKNIKVSLNGASLESYYNFSNSGNGTLLIYEADGYGTVRFTKNLWAKIFNLMVAGDNYLKISLDTGTIVMMINAIVDIPAVLTSSDYVELNTLGDVTYTFTSDRAEYDASGITVTSGVYVGATLSDLTADTDYTLTRSEEADSDGLYTYTLTIKESYLESAMGNYRGRYFKITVGDTVLTASMYLKPETEGWYARSGVDLVSEMTDDGYYTTATYKSFSTASLSTRIYYTVALDVTKPIVIEIDSIPDLEDDRWVLLQVTDTLKEMDYFSNDYQSTSKMQTLFFGSGRTDIQKLYGFVATASTNANYTSSSNTGIVIEVYFGATQSDGYFKINGSNCGTPTAVQSDFANGIAYIGWFSSLSGDFAWTLNSNVNGTAIISPQNDSAYAMDLGAAEDFAVTLANVQGELSVKDETGATLTSGSDYTYENGLLTIKADYFTNKTFTKSGAFYLWDEAGKTGTKFTMAYSSSNLASASIAFAAVGGTDSVSFDLNGVTSVTGVLYDDELIDSSLYSFADGKLTLVAEAVDVSVSGEQEFIVVGGSRLYPCYVIVREWSDGIYASGDGTVVCDNGTYTITGIVSFDEMAVYDLTKKYTFGIDFRDIDEYYRNGFNSAYTSVTLNFYDPYTGYTLFITLMANFSDDSVSTVNNALYIAYGIYNSEGGIVFATVSRGVNIAANENNTSASGLQSLQIEATGSDSITLVVCGRSYTINGLGGFNVDACVLTVDTQLSTSDSVAAVTVHEGLVDIYEKDEPDTPPVDTPDDPSDSGDSDSASSSDSVDSGNSSDSASVDNGSSTSAESGCGSVVLGGGIVFMIFVFALVFVLRKRTNKE